MTWNPFKCYQSDVKNCNYPSVSLASNIPQVNVTDNCCLFVWESEVMCLASVRIFWKSRCMAASGKPTCYSFFSFTAADNQQTWWNRFSISHLTGALQHSSGKGWLITAYRFYLISILDAVGALYRDVVPGKPLFFVFSHGSYYC